MKVVTDMSVFRNIQSSCCNGPDMGGRSINTGDIKNLNAIITERSNIGVFAANMDGASTSKRCDGIVDDGTDMGRVCWIRNIKNLNSIINAGSDIGVFAANIDGELIGVRVKLNQENWENWGQGKINRSITN